MSRTPAAEIVFDRVTKHYPGRDEAAVKELSLTIPAGEICVLVGPSGAGKTTAMKMVNRLIDFDEGDITIDGRSVRSLDETELRRRPYPAQLSGGQRQRVGLARALAADPSVMLMDEPFGALDPITRVRLQNELRRLHREVAKTVIFVTHDIDEAIMMGDRIAILR